MSEYDGSSRIYVDTNIWIYYIEGNEFFKSRVDAVFEEVERANSRLVTNEITLAECIIKPAEIGHVDMVAVYENIFARGEVDVTQLDGGLAKRAAIAAGRLGLKLIDAIHYVSAVESGCQYFLTADGHFKTGPEMTVVRITGLTGK